MKSLFSVTSILLQSSSTAQQKASIGQRVFRFTLTQPRTPTTWINPAESRAHLRYRNRNVFIKIFNSSKNASLGDNAKLNSFSHLPIPFLIWGNKKCKTSMYLPPPWWFLTPISFPTCCNRQPCQQAYCRNCGGCTGQQQARRGV